MKIENTSWDQNILFLFTSDLPSVINKIRLLIIFLLRRHQSFLNIYLNNVFMAETQKVVKILF